MRLPASPLLVAGTLVVAGAAGCRSNPSPSPSAPPAAPSSLDATAMFRHEVVGLAARDALVRGDLESARRHARELSLRATVDRSPAAAEGLLAMRAAADTLAGARDVPAAARAMGTLARTCGDCHQRLSGPVRPEMDPPRREGAPLRDRMNRHAWAMDQLWNGLVASSDPAWSGGVSALREPAVTSELVRRKDAPAIEGLAATVGSLGERAATTTELAPRAALYGELLATCAECHTQSR